MKEILTPENVIDEMVKRVSEGTMSPTTASLAKRVFMRNGWFPSDVLRELGLQPAMLWVRVVERDRETTP